MLTKRLVFILLLLPILCVGQPIPSDFIKRYDQAQTDKQKADAIRKYIARFENAPHQQKLKSFFDLQAHFLKREDKTALAYVEMGLGALIWSSGDPSTSFRYGVSVLPTFESIKDTASILNAYGLIGNSLNVSHNFQQQLHYLWKSYPIAKRFKSNPKSYSTVLNNLADCYAKMGQPDKALPYILEAVQISVKQNNRKDLPTMYCTLGETYFANKEYDMGFAVMHKSLKHGIEVNDWETNAYAMGEMAVAFEKTSQLDSARIYAQRAYALSKNDYMLIALESSELLHRNFDAAKAYDSAYFYLGKATELKDSIFSSEKTRTLQTLNFKEQLRQKEAEIEHKRQEHERLLFAQYAFTGIGIVTLIIIFLLLTHSVIVNTRMVKFFSIIGLLLVFEFLNLILHPLLGEITHHSPAWMLVCMAALASILIPAHHKLEHFATAKLIEKNKKIRLAAARKTIENLDTESGT